MPGRKSDLGPVTNLNSLSPLLKPLKFDQKIDFYNHNPMNENRQDFAIHVEDQEMEIESVTASSLMSSRHR